MADGGAGRFTRTRPGVSRSPGDQVVTAAHGGPGEAAAEPVSAGGPPRAGGRGNPVPRALTASAPGWLRGRLHDVAAPT